MNAHQIVLSSISHWIPPGEDKHEADHYTAWRWADPAVDRGRYLLRSNDSFEAVHFFNGRITRRAVVDDFGNLVAVA